MSIEDKVNARLKCRAYKPEGNPDGRLSMCGEKVEYDKDGRQFFTIPGHQRDYQMKLNPSYEFSETYDTSEGAPSGKLESAEPTKRGGRPRRTASDED
jgi:hypothetical protein